MPIEKADKIQGIGIIKGPMFECLQTFQVMGLMLHDELVWSAIK
jgi:hypothetical protein